MKFAAASPAGPLLKNWRETHQQIDNLPININRVLREAFQFFLDAFEYALVAEQPQTFPRKLPIGAEQRIIGAPAL